jgi:outer membrane biosynthesis protein TonB
VDNKWPEIPQLARRHTGWELLYEMTIDEKGKVVNVVPMSPKPFADRIVMDALSDWKFKPAMCGTYPVPTDFIVSMQ